MALLRTVSEWENFLKSIEIPEDKSKQYAQIFFDNEINEQLLLELDRDYLKSLGIGILGHVLLILKHVKLTVEPVESGIASGSSPSVSGGTLSGLPSISAQTVTVSTFKPPPPVRPTL